MNIDDLKKYVSSNNRICPIPVVWDEFVKILDLANTMPPNLIPLILNGWHITSDLDKRNRVLAQIDYASKDEERFIKLEKFILNIKENEWHYGSEPPSEEVSGLN